MFAKNNFLTELNAKFSTTRLCCRILGNNFLDEANKIKEELKFKINIPELWIRDSKIPKQGEEKFDTYLFLPPGEGRQGEGGLRTKGYFKFSYEIENGKWYTCDFRGKRLFEVEPPKGLDIDLEQFKSDDGIIRLPLITVITVVLNGEKYLEETIQSVINQTYPNVEYIIIDGGSTDGTLDIIKRYKNQIDYWVSEKDKGVYDAMNKGIDLASGEWINFLNAGDKFVSDNVLESVFYSKYYDADVMYGDTIVDYKLFKRIFYSLDIYFLEKGMPFSHQSVFVKSYLHKSLPFSNNFRLAADYDIFYKLFKKGIKFHKINIPISENSAYGIAFINRKKVLEEYRKINNNISQYEIYKEHLKGLIWRFINIII